MFFQEKGRGHKTSKILSMESKNQTIDFTCIDDVDVIINLAGENIFGLWTKSKKKRF